MKLTSKPSEIASFKPVELSISIESFAELEVFYQLGNLSCGMANLLSDRTTADESTANNVFHAIYIELTKYRNKIVSN